ncbi:MAG: hypothetical protein OXC91_15100 [Rhodobacteraceae bacterium]|nr:hypothetical protein [Paracoccaceae bacterium]
MVGIGKRIVHRKAVGMADLAGDDFANIFAEAIGGMSFRKPVGVADVAWNGCCWSIKTVSNQHPHRFMVGAGGGKRRRILRLISGRNSPVYSAGIDNPFADLQATGNAVLAIYNERIEKARRDHDDVRLLVFVRNMATQEFTIFERPIHPFVLNDYTWTTNDKGNFEAHCAGEHAFTWQPHGSQFTILESVPDSATRFKIRNRVSMLEMQHVLRLTRIRPEWIEVIDED